MKNTLNFCNIIAFFTSVIDWSLHDLMNLFCVHIFIWICNALERSSLFPLFSPLACCCICTKHILPYTIGDYDDDGVVILYDEVHCRTAILLARCSMDTRVWKKYVIEHSGIRVHRQSSKAKKKGSRERAREKWVGKRKHSMPMQKDKRGESEVTLVLFFVPQSWIEPT